MSERQSAENALRGLGVVWTCDNCGATTTVALEDEPAGWLNDEPDEDDYPEDEEVPWDLILCDRCRAPEYVIPPAETGGAS